MAKKKDIQRRNTSLKTITYSASNATQTVFIPKEGHTKILRGRLSGNITLAGGAASGTVISNPISPLGMVKKIYVEQSPAPKGGPKLELTLQQLHFLWYRAFRRKPRITGLSSGAAATTAVEAEFCLPMSLIQSYFDKQSLYPSNREINGFTLTVEFYTADSSTRDAILSGNDRTFTSTVVIQIMADDFVGADLVAPGFEVVWRYHKLPITSSGPSEDTLKVPAGEALRSYMGIVVNNSLRDDGFLGNFVLQVGAVRRVDMKFPELQAKNQSDMLIASSDWPTGLFFADLDVDKDLADVANIQPTGSDPKVIPDTTGGTSALSGTAYLEGVIESVIVTDAGQAAAAAAAAAAGAGKVAQAA